MASTATASTKARGGAPSARNTANAGRRAATATRIVSWTKNAATNSDSKPSARKLVRKPRASSAKVVWLWPTARQRSPSGSRAAIATGSVTATAASPPRAPPAGAGVASAAKRSSMRSSRSNRSNHSCAVARSTTSTSARPAATAAGGAIWPTHRAATGRPPMVRASVPPAAMPHCRSSSAVATNAPGSVSKDVRTEPPPPVPSDHGRRSASASGSMPNTRSTAPPATGARASPPTTGATPRPRQCPRRSR